MIKFLWRHYFITALFAVCYVGLSAYGTVQMFADITKINGAAATAYATLMSLPAAAVAIVKWRVTVNDRQISSE